MPKIRAGSLPVSAQIFFVAITVTSAIGALTLLWAQGHATLKLSVALAGAFVLGTAIAAAIVNAAIIGWNGQRPRWLWWALAAIAAVPMLLFPTHLPLRARWAASEWAFDRIVSTLPGRAGVTWQSPRSVSVPARVGLYSVSGVDIVPAGYVFHDPDGGDLGDTGDAGFIYLPDGPGVVPIEEGYVLVHLHAAWYSYWQAS